MALVTEVKSIEGKQRWEIKHFDLLLKSTLDACDSIESKEFQCAGGTWCLQIAGNRAASDAKDGAGAQHSSECSNIALYLRNVAPQGVRATFTFTLLNQQNIILITLTNSRVHKFDAKSGWGFQPFCTRADLTNNPAYTPSLTIECSITVVGDVEHDPGSHMVEEQKSQGQHQLDMARLLESGVHADVSFIMSDGTRIPAHKNILAIRSPVMKILFEAEMREARDGEVEMKDVDSKVFREMLRFMYTGKCSVERVDPTALFGLAHRYEVLSLQTLCASKMISSITASNVAERLVLAHTYDQGPLKERCLSFINSHLPDVISTRGFTQLTKSCPELLASVLIAQVPIDRRKRSRDDSDEDDDDDSGSLTVAGVKRLKVAELKQQLAMRGLSTVGRKTELLQRLEQSLRASRSPTSGVEPLRSAAPRAATATSNSSNNSNSSTVGPALAIDGL